MSFFIPVHNKQLAFFRVPFLMLSSEQMTKYRVSVPRSPFAFKAIGVSIAIKKIMESREMIKM